MRETWLVNQLGDNNVVDLSQESAGRIVEKGDGHDDITGTNGDDEIKAGFGDDIIRLGGASDNGGADEIIFTVSEGGVAVDGGDKIISFKRGEDKLTFQSGDGVARTLHQFLQSADGPNGVPLTADDWFILVPMIDQVSGVGVISGVSLHFRSSGRVHDGTQFASNRLRIEFQTPMSVDAFLQAIGGIENFDLESLAVKDVSVLPMILGENSLAYEHAGAPILQAVGRVAATLSEQTRGRLHRHHF